MITILAIPVVALIVVFALLQAKKRRKKEPPKSVRVASAPLGNVLGYTNPQGTVVLVSDVLKEDDDTDRPVRVVIHELLHVMQIARGDSTAHQDKPVGWYQRSADDLPYMAPFPPAEALWIGTYKGQHAVAVDVRDQEWLAPIVGDAIGRINGAAMRAVFTR